MIHALAYGADLAYGVCDKPAGNLLRRLGASLRDAFFYIAFRKQKACG